MSIKRVLLQDFINDICIIIDQGYKMTFDRVESLLEDSNLQSFLINNFPSEKVDIQLQFYSFTDEHWNFLEEILLDTYYNYGNKLGIMRSGLLLLVGLANSRLRNITD